MKTIFFATRVRGFFRQLFSSSQIDAQFVYNECTVYETNRLKNKILTAIGRSRIMDVLGIIQIPKCYKNEFDIIASFNRFLRTNRPYFIYVENPTALYHYRLNRKKYFLGAKRISVELSNPNLRGLIFMSKACESTFEQVCGPIRKGCISQTIYPLIPLNPIVNEDQIKLRCEKSGINLLYIAQGVRFISKGGLEIIEAYKRLKQSNKNVSLRIITSLSDISNSLINYIQYQEGIELYDFQFSFQELQKIYAESHVLLQPTSDDSFNLTVLEAIKSGMTILASRLYAIPEMVEDGVNGYLCDPHYWFFDEQNIPNPKVWNHRKKTIQSGHVSEEIVKFIEDKIAFFCDNKQELIRMSLNSLTKASRNPFSEEFIVGQWNQFLNEIDKKC